MARILCVLPYVPWPADSGGTLRTLRLLEALDGRHEVTAVAADLRGADADALRGRLRARIHVVRPRSLDAALDLAGMAAGRPFRYGRYGCSAMREAVATALAIGRFDAVHLDHLHTGQLAPIVRRVAPRAALVVDEHNVESLLLARLAAHEPPPRGPLLAWQARAVARLERAAVSAADVVLACSGTDAEELRRLGARRVRVIPNGVDLEPSASRHETGARDVVFVGSLDWRPNVLAALELAGEIWPEVLREVPGLRLVLVGRNPPPELRRVAGEAVHVTGTVPNVAPYLRDAFATAMPLRAGSGTRLKALEAAAAGVPIVATRLALEGLPLAPGRDVLLADTAAEFARAIVRLWKDPPLRARLAARAAAAARPFVWSEIGSALLEVYDALLAPETPPEWTREQRIEREAGGVGSGPTGAE